VALLDWGCSHRPAFHFRGDILIRCFTLIVKWVRVLPLTLKLYSNVTFASAIGTSSLGSLPGLCNWTPLRNFRQPVSSLGPIWKIPASANVDSIGDRAAGPYGGRNPRFLLLPTFRHCCSFNNMANVTVSKKERFAQRTMSKISRYARQRSGWRVTSVNKSSV